MNLNDLRETLADLCHQSWSGWQTHVHNVGERTSDGFVLLDRRRVESWERQIMTPYAGLTQREQDMDRAEADKLLAAMEAGVVAFLESTRYHELETDQVDLVIARFRAELQAVMAPRAPAQTQPGPATHS